MEWGTNKVGALQAEMESMAAATAASETQLKTAEAETARLRKELKAAQDLAQRRTKEVSDGSKSLLLGLHWHA